MPQRLYFGAKVRTDHDEALTRMREQIARQSIEPALIDRRRELGGAPGQGDPEPSGEGYPKGRDRARGKGEAVIGHGSGQAGARLDGVEPVHRGLG
ncbi:hypothetical protein D3C87_1639840 [compost metagenome]